MAVADLPKPAWNMQILPGVCPSCDRATALAVFFNHGKMPMAGAVRLRPMCLSCGNVWKLPEVTSELLENPPGMLDEKKPRPRPPDQAQE